MKLRVTAESLSATRRHPDPIRYGLVTLFCYARTQEITDRLVELLLHIVRKMGVNAEKRVDEALVADVKRVTGKTGLLFQMAEASLDHPKGQVDEVIYPVAGRGSRFGPGSHPLVVQGCCCFAASSPSSGGARTQTLLLDVAARCGVQRIVSLGAVLAAVPHTRPSQVTGSSTDPAWHARLEACGIRTRRSRYEGPTGMSTVVMDAATHRGLSALTLRGQAPHYLGGATNPAVSRALLTTVAHLLDLALDVTLCFPKIDSTGNATGAEQSPHAWEKQEFAQFGQGRGAARACWINTATASTNACASIDQARTSSTLK